ncbi:MAG: class I SAM-dependent methyltransferase [Patescibacteria group bacterium]
MKKENIKQFFPTAKLIVKKANKTEVQEGWLIFEKEKWQIKNGIVYTPIKSKIAQAEQKAIFEIDEKPELGGSGKNVAKKDYFNALDSLPIPNNNFLFFRPGSFQNISFAEKDFQKFLKFLGAFKRKLTILEIGADSGWASWQIAKKDHRIFSLDINHHLELRSHWLEKQVYFDCVQADMHQLPFDTETFDFVFAFEAIHHSYDLKKAASEIFRVLKPNGQFIFLREPMKGKFAKDRFGKSQKELGVSENLYATKKWLDTFRKAGFGNLKIESSDFSYQKIWLKVSLKQKVKFLLISFKKVLLKNIPILKEFFISNYNFSGTKKSI